MESPPSPAYARGQRVRSLARYHRGEVGKIIACNPADPPAYTVEFAEGSCVYLREDELEPPHAEG
jgi:hypothetical protein